MFKSFFLAGFECATGYNRHRQWIDQIASTQHDRYLSEDYARLTSAGIHSVREGVRWPLSDMRGKFDFHHLGEVLRHARAHEVELILDLFHYGYPDDVDLFDESMPIRFAEYCAAAAKFIAANSDGPYYFTPVNEPSFFAWAGGEVGLFAPHEIHRGDDLKYALVRAAIAGTNAIWSVIPEAEIVNVDPICHVVPGRPEDAEAANNYNNSVVFQSLDMLSGRLAPELGGSARHLGTIGINYYWNNQWVLEGDTLPEDDPRRVPLRELVRRVYDRYHTNVMLGETAHVGDARANWLRSATTEIISLLEEDVPVHGICLYPIISMPEWHAQEEWTHMGLWDLHASETGELERHLHAPAYDALMEAQAKVSLMFEKFSV
ncbi:MAG TPA: glycoside hydrolase [Candidatus Kapabacteria bacterium]|jgi:hypothetical protein|nr:glycoside hydrolase [Candidatus Kapabacteria bacterium]